MSELLEADLLDALVDAVCEEYTSSKEVVTRRGGFFLGTKENGFWKKVLARLLESNVSEVRRQAGTLTPKQAQDKWHNIYNNFKYHNSELNRTGAPEYEEYRNMVAQQPNARKIAIYK